MEHAAFSNIAHMLFDSQKVKDIKLSQENGELAREMGRFRRGLRRHSFVPEDKVPVALKPKKVEGGVFWADIDGSELSSDLDSTIHVRFPLNLHGYNGPTDVEKIFSSVEKARVDDGGNVQNQLINTLLALVSGNIRELIRRGGMDVRITVASSSDPFARVPGHLQESVRENCDCYNLGLPDRFAIQVPWEDGRDSGRLAITSEPQRTYQKIENLIMGDSSFHEAFKNATCFISSDPIYEPLEKYAMPGYLYVINASSAFRSLVATESYNRSVLLPMNRREASDVAKLLLQQRYSQELHKIKAPPFDCPIAANGVEIDREALASLDESLDVFRSYIPLKRIPGRLAISSPITFMKDGGLVVGVCHDEIACFTSTPHPDKEMHLLDEFGDPELVLFPEKDDVGAGDASATVVSLFGAVDPFLFIKPHFEGREEEDRFLGDLACTIFVSVLSRIAGSFTIRNRQTNWSNIRPDAFQLLFQEAARESLQIARETHKRVQVEPVIKNLDRWGIQVLSWKLGKIPKGYASKGAG